MAIHPQLPTAFMTDLDVVCPKADDVIVPSGFLEDLELAYLNAQTYLAQQPQMSVADLANLEVDLKVWRENCQRILREHMGQLPPDDPLRSPISLFGTMDYGRLETAHTRTLAWLLGRNEHGFGNELLSALLRHLTRDRQVRLTTVHPVESEFRVVGGIDDGRIDVFAHGLWEENGRESEWLLVIEAKIDAQEAGEQLSGYDGRLDDKYGSAEIIRVFLTPNGRAARTGAHEWRRLSFTELAIIFRRVDGLQDKHGYHFLRHYLTGVMKDICGIPVPLKEDCQDPFMAVEYLESVLGLSIQEKKHGPAR